MYRAMKQSVGKKAHPLPSDPSRMDRFKYSLYLPPQGELASNIAFVIIILMIWGVGNVIIYIY